MERSVIDISDHGQFQVVLEPDEEDGGYVVECLDLKGCISEGDTREGAIGNIREAIEGVCESMVAHHGCVMRATEGFSTTYSEWPEESYSNTTLEYA